MRDENQRYAELSEKDRSGPVSSDYSSDFFAGLRRSARNALLDYFDYSVTVDTLWCDVACNNGYNLKDIQRRGAQIKGVDLCANAVAIARQNGLDAHVGSMTELSFSDNEFDVTVLMEALYHVSPDDQILAMAENIRVTKPGGIVVHVTTNLDSILRRFRPSDMHRYGYDLNEINDFFVSTGAEGAVVFPRFPFGWGLSAGPAESMLTPTRLALFPVVGMAWRMPA